MFSFDKTLIDIFLSQSINNNKSDFFFPPRCDFFLSMEPFFFSGVFLNFLFFSFFVIQYLFSLSLNPKKFSHGTFLIDDEFVSLRILSFLRILKNRIFHVFLTGEHLVIDIGNEVEIEMR